MPVNDLSGALIDERIRARRRVVNISRRIKRNELRIARSPKALAKVDALERELELACRDLAEVVEASPERTWPHGWKITPDVKP